MRFVKLIVGGGLTCAVAFGASAIAGDYGAEVLAKYEKTGESVSCLSLPSVKDTDPLDDQAIMFEVRGGDVYLNELRGVCAGLGLNKRFSYKTTQNRICRGDIITVSDPVGNSIGSCSLGEFEALTKIDNSSAP